MRQQNHSDEPFGTNVEYATYNPESCDGKYLVFEGEVNVQDGGDYYLYTSTGGCLMNLNTYVGDWDGSSQKCGGIIQVPTLPGYITGKTCN